MLHHQISIKFLIEVVFSNDFFWKVLPKDDRTWQTVVHSSSNTDI